MTTVPHAIPEEVVRYLTARGRFLGATLGERIDVDAELRRFLHEQPWGAFVLPLNGQDSFANEYARALTGADVPATADDWADRFLYQDSDGDPLPIDHLPSIVALSGETPPPRRIRLYDRENDERVDIYAYACPHLGADGQVLGSIGISLGVADWARDRSWGTHTSLSMLLRQTPNAIAILDRDGRYLACSVEWRAQSECTVSDPVGVLHEDAFDDPDPRWRDHVARVLRGETVGEDAMPVPSPVGGIPRYVQWRYVPWHNPFGDVGGVVMYRRDVTSEQHAQRRLKRANRTLRRQNEALEQFAYAASHDLQEPLRSIRQFAELMSRRYEDELDERGQRYLGHMVAGAQRISSMVDGLLAFARAGESVDLDVVSLDDRLRHVLVNLEASISESDGVVKVVAPLPPVLGHTATVDSALQNVLSNAIKYRAPSRRLRVHVSAEVDGEYVVVRIRDNGRGFASEHSERVFRLFRRLDNVADTRGSGLGLALVRRQLDAIGASISAESAPDQGTTITLRWLRA